MAQSDAQSVNGMSSNRVALLGVYAALDPQLRDELGYVGLEFPDSLDPYAQLRAAAQDMDQHPYPGIPRLQLAFATMAVLRNGAAQLTTQALTAQEERQARVDLTPVILQLVNTEKIGIDRTAVSADLERADADVDLERGGIGRVYSALTQAAHMKAEQRWLHVIRRAYQYLDPELQVFADAQCWSELRSYQDEVVSMVRTKLVVRHPRTLQQIAPALLPHNWKHCNDFFCELIRTPERDATCRGATGGDLSADSSHWRGVYEERVGTCPAGWFPDTFLLFTWDRSDHQLVLRYELAPRLANDRTVLRIDQGHINVNWLPDSYEVSTLKHLLFDDKFIPGGGQTLGQAACELGWLDYSVNQFTACADELSPGGPSTPNELPPGGIDAGLQQVLDRCEAYLRETVTDTGAQFDKTMAKIRDGNYSLNDFVGDWGKMAIRAIRDGSRALECQIDYAWRSLELARTLAQRPDNRKDTSP